MPISRNIFIKGLKYIYLFKGIIDMIIASYDMGYFRIQVINYNQYNIYNGPVNNNLVDDFLIKPESPKKLRERRLSVVSQSWLLTKIL